MSREITDTKGKYNNDPLPEGRRLFIVAGPVEKKYGKNGGEYFVWKFQYPGGIGEQVMLPNMMAGLLRALRCEEPEANKFDWETTEQEGKEVVATVTFQPDKNDPSKMRQRMSDFAHPDDNKLPF